MSDRELLEKAAKAAEIELWHEDVFTNGLTQKVSDNGILCWNPLWKDDDALRLAVKLEMSLVMFSIFVRVDTVDYEDIYEEYGDDRYAATRRAIVRAAAQIGEQHGN